jgi:hypothetical protein
MAAGFLLLGIYIAMYLAVAGFVHFLTPADAVAIAPNGSTIPASAAIAPKPPAETADRPSLHRSEPSVDGYAMHRTE